MVSKKMRKICALFCSLGVLTGINNRYSKSCEKCSQNLISYERAQAESFSLIGFLSRFSWGVFKVFGGTLGFLSLNDFVSWVNLRMDTNKQQTLKKWWKVGFILVAIDGLRDIVGALDLGDERADFELLKEIHDKNYKGKSNAILNLFKENNISATFSEIRLLENLIEFPAYWGACRRKVAIKVVDIVSSKANLLGLDKKSMTLDEILEVLKSRGMKKIVDDILMILKGISLNIDCVVKLKDDCLKGKLIFKDVNSKFVEIQKSQQSLYEEANKNLTDLCDFMQKISEKC